MRKIIVLISVILFFASCSEDGMRAPRIMVYAAGGQQIWYSDMDSLLPNEKVLYQRIGESHGGLEKVDRNTFLFQKNAGSGTVFEFDLRSSKVHKVIEGHDPIYFKKLNKIIIQKGIPGKNMTGLFIADYPNPSTTVKQIDTRQNRTSTAVKISWREIVIFPRYYSNMNAVSYDLINDKSSPLPALNECDGDTSIWRSASEQMLCREIINEQLTHKWFLTSLDGKRKQYLNLHPSIKPYEYDDRRDVFYYGLVRIHLLKAEVTDVWAYDFKTGETEKVLSGIANVGPGGLITLDGETESGL